MNAPADTASGADAGNGPGGETGQATEAATGVPAASPAPLERLLREPARFSLDQATRVLAPGADPVDVDYRHQLRLGMPSGEVGTVRPAATGLTATTLGLVGPGGVLPRHYTAWVEGESRQRSTAMQAFLDLLARRFTGLFVKAGSKYLPTRNPMLADTVLTAAVGLATPGLTQALDSPLQALLFHAGGLSTRGRSVERLRGMLSEEVGCAVRIIEFAGGWMRLPPSEQTRLLAPGMAGQHARLGVDATLGSQVWDAAGRFLVHLGPLPRERFEALLPGSPLHTRLVELIQLHVGLEEDFAFKPVLAAREVPALQLRAPGQAGARLGWTSWLTQPGPRRRDADDAMVGREGPRTLPSVEQAWATVHG